MLYIILNCRAGRPGRRVSSAPVAGLLAAARAVRHAAVSSSTAPTAPCAAGLTHLPHEGAASQTKEGHASHDLDLREQGRGAGQSVSWCGGSATQLRVIIVIREGAASAPAALLHAGSALHGPCTHLPAHAELLGGGHRCTGLVVDRGVCAAAVVKVAGGALRNGDDGRCQMARFHAAGKQAAVLHTTSHMPQAPLTNTLAAVRGMMRVDSGFSLMHPQAMSVAGAMGGPSPSWPLT